MNKIWQKFKSWIQQIECSIQLGHSYRLLYESTADADIDPYSNEIPKQPILTVTVYRCSNCGHVKKYVYMERPQ